MNAEILKHVNLAEILKEAAQSPLGIVALGMLILSALALVFFHKASVKVRLGVFGAFFLGVVLLASFVIVRYTPAKGSASLNGIHSTTPITEFQMETPVVPQPPQTNVLRAEALSQRLNVVFKTAKTGRGGTDANVSIILYGTKHVSKKYTFSGRGKAFEQGSTDVFTISATPPLGEITRCVVSRDDAGDKEEWFLEEVTVIDLETKAKTVFAYHNWVGKFLGKGSHSVSLKPTR
jgi:hypothetical protein